MSNYFMQAVDRIESIDFRKDEYRKYSVTVLFSEYLRRMSVFLKEINDGKSIGKYFLIRAAKEIGREYEINLENLCPNLSKANFYFVHSICSYYLEWSMLADEGNQIVLKYFDIYEPLIMFMERGGRFRKEHGFVDVYKCAIYATYNFSTISNIQPIDISEAALDRYDMEDDFRYKLVGE